jgi:hypothetical protein
VHLSHSKIESFHTDLFLKFVSFVKQIGIQAPAIVTTVHIRNVFNKYAISKYGFHVAARSFLCRYPISITDNLCDLINFSDFVATPTS